MKPRIPLNHKERELLDELRQLHPADMHFELDSHEDKLMRGWLARLIGAGVVQHTAEGYVSSFGLHPDFVQVDLDLDDPTSS